MTNKTYDIFNEFLETRIVFLKDDIDADSATKLAAILMRLDSKNHDEIKMYINCYGGTISGMLIIYDTIMSLKSKVSTICLGEAYSGAAVLLMAGNKGERAALPNSKIMIHGVQVGDISGSQPEVTKELKRIRKENDTMLRIISKHTGQSLKKVRRDCSEDKYFTAQEAMKYNLIDRIIEPQR